MTVSVKNLSQVEPMTCAKGKEINQEVPIVFAKAVNYIKGLFGFGDEESRVPLIRQSDVWECDAFRPEKDYRRILKSTETKASADAIRHAEGMLHRQFPITDEARIAFESRLASLRQAFEGGMAETRVRIEVLEGDLGIRTQDVEEVEQEAARVADQAPQPDRAVWPRRRRGRGEQTTPGRHQRRESRRLNKIRRERAEEARESERELFAARRELELIPIETRNLAEKEMAFAEQVVSTYVSAVFSSMPAGSLQTGEGLAEQRSLDVEIPDWVPEREADEEPDDE